MWRVDLAASVAPVQNSESNWSLLASANRDFSGILRLDFYFCVLTEQNRLDLWGELCACYERVILRVWRRLVEAMARTKVHSAARYAISL